MQRASGSETGRSYESLPLYARYKTHRRQYIIVERRLHERACDEIVCVSEGIYLWQSAGPSVIDDSDRQGTALNRATTQRGFARKTQGG